MLLACLRTTVAASQRSQLLQLLRLMQAAVGAGRDARSMQGTPQVRVWCCVGRGLILP